MECFVYKGNRKNDTYLYLTRDGDFSQVPQSLLDMLGQLQKVLSVHLDKKRTLANADINIVKKQLDEQGYYLQLPPSIDQTYS